VVTCRNLQRQRRQARDEADPCPSAAAGEWCPAATASSRSPPPVPAARGMKEFVAEVCSGCNGEGRIREKKKLKVKIPPGMDSGTHLVMPGEGNGGVSRRPPGIYTSS